jgi:predicted small secreted protein
LIRISGLTAKQPLPIIYLERQTRLWRSVRDVVRSLAADGEEQRPRARAGNTAKEVGLMIKALKMWRLALVAPVLVAFSVAACGDTWRGAKEDTKENVQTTGQGIEKAGENIQKRTQ